jgi:hypothetical protein
MSLYQTELAYMTRTYSQSMLSQITGVPQSTLSYVLNGQRDLPSQYQQEVRNQYSQLTYDNLIYSGANSYSALQDQGKPPTEIIDLEYRWQNLVRKLAKYTLTKDLIDTGLDYTDEYIESHISDYLQSSIDRYHKTSVSLIEAENNVWYTPKTEI